MVTIWSYRYDRLSVYNLLFIVYIFQQFYIILSSTSYMNILKLLTEFLYIYRQQLNKATGTVVVKYDN